MVLDCNVYEGKLSHERTKKRFVAEFVSFIMQYNGLQVITII